MRNFVRRRSEEKNLSLVFSSVNVSCEDEGSSDEVGRGLLQLQRNSYSMQGVCRDL